MALWRTPTGAYHHSTPTRRIHPILLVFPPIVCFALGSSFIYGSEQVDAVTHDRDRVVRAVRIRGPIVVDGLFDEPEWQLAEPATDFTQKIPYTGLPATERTEVRLLYDDENLYVGVRCFDSAGPDGIVVNDISKDFGTTNSDGFQVAFDTFHDKRNSFLFATNPRGGRFDRQVGANGAAGNTSWDGIWYVATAITDEGWQGEMAIPFKTLRFSRDHKQVWGVNFERRVRRKVEDSYWSPITPPFRLSRISLAGTLEGIEGIKQSRNLWLKPFVTALTGRRQRGSLEFEPEAGLDLKYGVTSEMTLDLTLNTDFSQVEADDEQINLTRFPLFFPEKRQFFLENAGIFDWGWRTQQRDVLPFFSRRIGLTRDGEIVPIVGGGRLTGRAGPYSIGLLSMQSEDYAGTPGSNFAVARLRRNILRQSDVGGIIVNKHTPGLGYNRTYGADIGFNFFHHLDLSSYLVRTDSPGVDERNTASSIQATWVDGFFNVGGAHLRVGENFNPEGGFVRRRGIHRTSGEFGVTSRPQSRLRWVREFNPALEADHIANQEDVLESRALRARMSITFRDSSLLEFLREGSFERLEAPFEIRTGQQIPLGDYGFSQYSVSYRTDRSRTLSAQASISSGDFYDGARDAFGLSVTVNPDYRVRAVVSWDRNDVSLPGGEFTTDLISTRVVYSFSNRMFLNALIQYNGVTGEIISNIRFNLIHRPLSDFYIVYNERRISGGDVVDRALIAKLTYLFAF